MYEYMQIFQPSTSSPPPPLLHLLSSTSSPQPPSHFPMLPQLPPSLLSHLQTILLALSFVWGQLEVKWQCMLSHICLVTYLSEMKPQNVWLLLLLYATNGTSESMLQHTFSKVLASSNYFINCILHLLGHQSYS